MVISECSSNSETRAANPLTLQNKLEILLVNRPTLVKVVRHFHSHFCLCCSQLPESNLCWVKGRLLFYLGSHHDLCFDQVFEALSCQSGSARNRVCHSCLCGIVSFLSAREGSWSYLGWNALQTGREKLSIFFPRAFMSPDQEQNGMKADGERVPLASIRWTGWFAW